MYEFYLQSNKNFNIVKFVQRSVYYVLQGWQTLITGNKIHNSDDIPIQLHVAVTWW